MSTISSTSSTFSFNTNNLATEFAQQSNATENGGNLTAADCANIALNLQQQGNSDANFWATLADGGSNGNSLVGNTGFSLADLASLASGDGNSTNVTYADLQDKFGAANVAAKGSTISLSQLETTAGKSNSTNSTNKLLTQLLALFMMVFSRSRSNGYL